MKKAIISLAGVSLLALMLGCYGRGNNAGNYRPQELVEESAATVRLMSRDPNYASLNVLLRNSKGVLIFPSVVKAGFIAGGQAGDGVLSGRMNGNWTDPAFYTLGGGSLGLQVGFTNATMIFVFMTDKAFRNALDTGLTLGVDATVAAGNIDADAVASTLTSPADVYYFADVDGVFIGISLEGGAIVKRDGYNESYYGPGATPSRIILQNAYEKPDALVLIDALRGAAAGPSAMMFRKR